MRKKTAKAIDKGETQMEEEFKPEIKDNGQEPARELGENVYATDNPDYGNGKPADYPIASDEPAPAYISLAEGAADLYTVEPEPVEPEPVAVFGAILSPVQILKDAVKMELLERYGNAGPHETILTFNRDILPADYDWDNGAKFKLAITKA